MNNTQKAILRVFAPILPAYTQQWLRYVCFLRFAVQKSSSVSLQLSYIQLSTVLLLSSAMSSLLRFKCPFCEGAFLASQNARRSPRRPPWLDHIIGPDTSCGFCCWFCKFCGVVTTAFVLRQSSITRPSGLNFPSVSCVFQESKLGPTSIVHDVAYCFLHLTEQLVLFKCTV